MQVTKNSLTGTKNVDFTLPLDFAAADLVDLGETGLVSEALNVLFNETNYTHAGQEYTIKRVTQLEVKLLPINNKVRVILFGKVDLGGLIKVKSA